MKPGPVELVEEYFDVLLGNPDAADYTVVDSILRLAREDGVDVSEVAYDRLERHVYQTRQREGLARN